MHRLSAERPFGQIPEWPNGADCKSAVFRLRWFESIFAHKTRSANALLVLFSNPARFTVYSKAESIKKQPHRLTGKAAYSLRQAYYYLTSIMPYHLTGNLTLHTAL